MKPIIRIISLSLSALLSLTLISCNVEKSISEVEDAARSAVENMSMPKIEAPSLVQPDDAENVGDFSSIDEINAESKNYQKLDITTGYNALENDTQRDFYNKMASYIYIVGSNKTDKNLYLIERIILDSSLDEKEIRVAISAFKNDHPEIFWLSNQFSYIPSDTTEIQLYSDLSPKDIQRKSDELITSIRFFINKVPAGLSEFERELKIHDLLLSTCCYNDTVESASDDWQPFSIYGALVNGSAVCEGYSRAMQYLLSIFGIECNTINGMGKNNPHQWNVVKIGGEWYHLDATWNDTTDNNIYYDYFNVSDSVITYDHEIAAKFTQLSFSEICGDDKNDASLFNIFIPDCSSDQANFYTRNSVLFDGVNDECTSRIEAQIQTCINSAENIVYIMVDSSIEYDDAINLLFYEQPYQFFKYIEDINERNGYLIDDEHVSFLKRERESVIEVHMQYN